MAYSAGYSYWALATVQPREATTLTRRRTPQAHPTAQQRGQLQEVSELLSCPIVTRHIPSPSHHPMSSIEQRVTGAQLETAGIIPDVLPVRYSTASFAVFPVTFEKSGAAVDCGNTLQPSAAQQPRYSLPPSIAASGSSSDLYCVVMYDPDGPSRRNPRFRNILHLVHANITHSALAATVDHASTDGAGTVHLPYRPPGPPQGAGKHRYVWLLYRQAAPVDLTRLPSFGGMSGAGKQKPSEIEERLKLLQGVRGSLDLVAVNWHEAEWEQWVSDHMREQFGWISVPIMWILRTFVV